MPGVPGFWLAAGLSLNGFGGAGGIGKTIAEWMISGETELDTHGMRAWRFGAAYRNPRQVEAAGREVYRYYYRLRYPLDADIWGRPNRLSPLHGRMQDLGAVFASKNGWERPDHLRPGMAWRRAGEDQRAYGWHRPPELDRVAEEHRAFRERAGMIDMTSFGKIDVSGPGALALLERVSVNRIDRPPGSVIYTQWANHRGGIVADVTVTRLAEERFRVVTGAGVVDSDAGWLRMNARREGDVTIRECSEELAVIGIWGPRSRDILQAVSHDDVSAEAIRFRTARTIGIGPANVLAQRITYVGELGFELYAEPGDAVQVWDRLTAAGAQHGVAAGGYRVLESLRMEKGYRYMGTDLTAGDTPYEAGLGFCVALDKGDFNGREALAAAAEPRAAAADAAGRRRGVPLPVRRRGRPRAAARWRAAFAAVPTASRSGATSPMRTCPRPRRPATTTRSRCWANWCPRGWLRTCSTTPRTSASVVSHLRPLLGFAVRASVSPREVFAFRRFVYRVTGQAEPLSYR